MSQNFLCCSEKMVADNVASNSAGSFFHLFDWNRKSRKKLFSATNAFSVGTIQGKQDEDNNPTSSNSVDDDGMLRVSSIKGRSEYSYASSMTDEEEKATRTLGVVARLMGLDSMPTPGISEPCSSPDLNTKSHRDDHIYGDDLPHDYVIARGDVYSGKPVEFRLQNMPSSPIERFQIETFPSRLIKPIPHARHKLLTPVKNPGLISAVHASHIIKSAVKILEPELQNGSTARGLSFRSSREIIRVPKQITRIPESFRGTVQSAVHESNRVSPFNRSCDRLEDAAVTRPLAHISETNSSGANCKEKSVSLAIQAKLNVQRREGFSMKSGNTSVMKDNGDHSSNKPLKNLSSNQKYNHHKRYSDSSTSSVLRQNSQKQSKSNLATKQSVGNQQGRKTLPGDALSGKTKIVNKLSGNSKAVFVKEGLQTAYTRKVGFQSSNNKNLVRKKRLVVQSSYTERSNSIDDISLNRHGRQVRHIVVLDECAMQSTDNSRNSTDVVSFTFTSPVRKSPPKSLALDHKVKKCNSKNECSISHSGVNADVANEEMPSHLDEVEGDSLGILIERKLRELTNGTRSPYCKLITGGSGGEAAPFWNNSKSSFDVSCVTLDERESESVFSSHDDELFDSSSSLTYDKEVCVSHKMQEMDGMDICTSSPCLKEIDHKEQSPVSILENSFSNESCYLSESWEYSNGSKTDRASSIVSEDIDNWNSMGKALLLEPETESSDSTSASSTQTMDGPLAVEICRGCHHSNTCWQELKYVQDILINTEFVFDNLLIYATEDSFGILDPLIFDKLEENKSLTTEGEDKDCRIRRKILFDSLNECLGMKLNHYFQAGYQAWANGIAVVRKDLAEDLYEEISGWKSIGDWMIDELVDKDMSTHLGRWINFENDAFEAGVELEGVVLNTLIDEVIVDFL